MSFKVFPLAAIALLLPTVAIAQISDRCSQLKEIYVLPRATYSFTVSGSCVHTDGKHSPYLTKQAYQDLDPKPTVEVFY